MVFPRYFFALCALFLFVAIGGIHAEVQTDSAELTDAEVQLYNTFIAERNGEIEDSDLKKDNGIVSIIIKLIKQAFKWATEHCLMEAALQCKKHWTNPSGLINCAMEYFIVNNGRCLARPATESKF